MARRDRSYARGMQEYAEEKRFLRKVRHRVFHPDYESPLLFRLGGYVLRLVLFVAVVGAILFVRNRSYFSGPVFRESLQAEMDHYTGGTMSEMPDVTWKNDLGNFKNAMDEYARLRAEAKSVNHKLANPEILGKDIGQEIAAVASGVLSGIIILAFAFIYMFK